MFWEKCQKLCEYNNQKMRDVAKNLNISSATITKWKNGTTPNPKYVNEIANYFGVSVDYLLNEDEISITPKTKRSFFSTLIALPQRWASLAKGDTVSDNEIFDIKNYVNCSMQFLFNEDIKYKPFHEQVDINCPKDLHTLFLILRILDKCADNETYRIIQVQLSRIVLFHLEQINITQKDLVDSQRFQSQKLDYLYTGQKNKDKTCNYGLNFSDISAVVEYFDISGDFQFLFTGLDYR
ncbi:MAG: helix-turn-helix domain-containing protein [Ruminococcus sp.]|nr:helix-turn-helix domain-containing protein [Ruminococcus sp.]